MEVEEKGGKPAAGGLVGARDDEATIRQSERQFRLLVEGVTDYAIYMLDPEGRVTNWNSGAQRIKGYTADEIVGQHFSTFYTEEDRARDEPCKALRTALEVGRFEKEGLRVRKNGSRFWAHVVIDAIRDDAGQLIGYAKVTRDITERMESQRALEAAREAFFQSQKMETIGQLTGGIAHDFNNLLTAVLGSLELLRKRLPDDPRSIQLLDNAVQGATRGAALTQRMLAFARRQELDTEAVDIPALVGGIGELLKRTLGPNISLQTEFSSTLPAALADANQLELAILNLAVNSRDAMPDGGVITISAREDAPDLNVPDALSPGRYLVVSVRDTGEGMDAETLARATEPFFTTKGVGKGTGLGLSMVQGLAEQLGGRLRMLSQIGVGTTAEFWLPVTEAGSQPRMEPLEIPTGKAEATLRILAVDDDALILMNTVAMLEDLGHTVFDAGSGPEALEVLDKEAVDLVITDHAMPRMTGTELAKSIWERSPRVPVVLATGYAEIPGGADPGLLRLAKPFGQSDLQRVITDAMKAKPVDAI